MFNVEIGFEMLILMFILGIFFNLFFDFSDRRDFLCVRVSFEELLLLICEIIVGGD